MRYKGRAATQTRFLRLCALLVVCVAVPGCHRQAPKIAPAVQAPPASPHHDALNIAEQEFRDGQCVEAIGEYRHYLQVNPAAPDGDFALLRIAICQLLPQSASHDRNEGLKTLNDLVSRFPGSASRPYAELILAADEELRQQMAQVEQCNARIQGISEELESARKAENEARSGLRQLEAANAKEIKEKDTRIRQLTANVEELEEKIRRLSEDLEALKKIDLQRRPSRPR